jgi:hypothetical protein
MPSKLSRRDFLTAALAAGATIAVAPSLQAKIRTATAALGAEPRFYFFSHARARTCSAIAARIVPTGDSKTDPGATEARADVFIDRFLAAFELPSSVADGPAIYVNGRYSGRFPYGKDGKPSTHRLPDDFLDGKTAQFLPLTGHQQLSWRAQLEGTKALDHPPAHTYVSKKWRAQVGKTLPEPPNLRKIYADGLDAFDAYSKSVFGVPFADASAQQQDVMLEVAGNVILSNFPLPSPPAAPDAAKALFPQIVVNTFQACYSAPEYRWDTSTDLWRSIGFDGDTQPLGNSIYNEHAYGPGKGPNAGFGDPKVYQPRGDYREYRPVSTPEGGDGLTMTEKDAAPIRKAMRARNTKKKKR